GPPVRGQDEGNVVEERSAEVEAGLPELPPTWIARGGIEEQDLQVAGPHRQRPAVGGQRDPPTEGQPVGGTKRPNAPPGGDIPADRGGLGRGGEQGPAVRGEDR